MLSIHVCSETFLLWKFILSKFIKILHSIYKIIIRGMHNERLKNSQRKQESTKRPHEYSILSIHAEWILERETGFEPATFSLGSWRSTTELLPQKRILNFTINFAFMQAFFDTYIAAVFRRWNIFLFISEYKLFHISLSCFSPCFKQAISIKYLRFVL